MDAGGPFAHALGTCRAAGGVKERALSYTSSWRRFTALFVSLFLMAALMPAADAADAPVVESTDTTVPADSPVETPPAEEESAEDEPVEVAASVEQRAEAERTGKPVEVVEARTVDSTYWVNPDGTMTVDVFAGPIRVWEGSELVEIDTTLVVDEKGVHPQAADADVVFSAGGRGEMASVSKDGVGIGFGWPDVLPVPELEGSVATYRDVLPGIDLELEALPGGYAKRFVVRERPKETLVLRFPVELSGLELVKAETTDLELKDDSGRLFALAAAPRMWGAARNPESDEPIHEMDVDYTLGVDGSYLELRPDAGFLADPKVELPIVIDPSTNLATSADTHVQSNSTVSKWTDVELKAGTYDDGDTKARSLLKFNTSTLTGKHILDADINLYEFHSWSCSARQLNVHRVTAAFNSSTLWSNQPGTGALAGSVTVAKGYSSSCPDGWIQLPVTGLVQQWADGTYPNDGVRVMAASETDTYGWKKFNSADASSNKPYLSVTYNSKPTVTSPTPPANTYTTDLTPGLTATFNDADGGTGTLYFEVADNNTGALVTSGSKTGVANGAASTWSPTSNLTSQYPYKWRVRAYDGTDYSAWTAYFKIVPDNTPPAAPSTASTSHPAEATWYPHDDPLISFSVADTTGITGYSYAFDQVSNTTPDTTSEGTTPSRSYSNVADGAWYFHVRAKDGAGNWGATKHRIVRIDDTAPGVPTVASSTHPDQEHWYTPADGADFNDPTFSWSGLTDTSGVNGYSYELNQIPTFDPDTTSEGTATAVSLTDIGSGGSGVFYFHVKARNGSGIWGAPQHYKVQVDTGGVTFTHPVNDTILAGDVTLEAETGPNAAKARFEVWDGEVWSLIAEDTTADTSGGGFEWSVTWETATVTPGPYQLRVIPIFSGGAGQAATGPVVTVDDTRLGVNPWWTFHDIGGGAQANLGTGNVVLSATDLSVPTAAGALTFTRTYNSQGSAFAGPLGWGWDFSLPTDAAPAGFTSLTHVTNDGEYIEVLDSTGEPLFFLLEDAEENPAWMPEPGAEGMTVEEDTHGTYGPVWKLTDVDGTIYYFERNDDDPEVTDVPYPLLGSKSAADGAGETVYEYENGVLDEVTAPGGKKFTIAWSGGRITSIDAGFVGTSGAEIQFGYTNGHLTTVTDVRTGLVWTYGYDNTSHRMTSITPPGQATYELDYLGNKLEEVKRNIPGGGQAITALTYVDSPTEWEHGMVTTLTTPRSDHWVYRFDTSSRLRELDPPIGATQATIWDVHNQVVTSQTAAEAEAGVSTTNVYSSAENPCNLSGAAEGANDGTDLCSVTRPGLGTTTFEYDEGLGGEVYHLVTKETRADGTYTVFGYDSNGIAARKPSTEETYSAGEVLLQSESWVYDANGNVTSETRPDGKMTTFTYSGGLLTAINGPGVTPDRTYTHDDWGNILTETWPESVVTNHYDSATRLEWTEATSSTLEDVDRVTTTYDDDTGLIETVGDTNHTISYTYDTWGRVFTEADGLGETTTFGYDAESNLISRSDSKGTTNFEVDALGRITEMADTGVGTTTIGYTVAAGSLVSTTEYPNDVSATTTSRAGVGDLESVSYEGPGGSLGVFTRSYDTLGRVETESGPLVNREYDYDALGRLVEARDYDPATSDQLETREYGFDTNTNRTSLTVTPTGVSPVVTTYQIATDGSDRLVSIDSGTALVYDTNGNTESMPGRTLEWTAANRMLAVTDGSVTVEYGLDPLGRTLNRTATGGAEDSESEYHYSADADTASWVADTVDEEETITRYVNGGGGLLATQIIGGDISYPLYTPHGNVWAWTDDQGGVTSTSVYDEYGNPLQPVSGDLGVDRYGWLGQQQREWDTDLTLTLMGVRGYDPALGRFLTVDPIRGGSANDYDYVSGDPLNHEDLDGTVKRPRGGGFGRGGGGRGGGSGGGGGRPAVAGKITGYTSHGIHSVISRPGGGVSPRAILDTIRSPIRVIYQANGRVRYEGRVAVVVMEGTKVHTAWALSREGLRFRE